MCSPILEDRAWVYQPTTPGHAYSTLVLLPEKQPGDPAWVVSLSVQRVASDQDREQVGAAQVQRLLTAKHLPFHQDLKVEVGNTSYSKREYLVTIVRLRSNRVFYRAYASEEEPGKGHPRWHGERLALRQPETWPPPDEETTFSICTTDLFGSWAHRPVRPNRGVNPLDGRKGGPDYPLVA